MRCRPGVDEDEDGKGRRDGVQYNLYDPKLAEKFKPIIKPVTCEKEKCMCQVGFLLPKHRKF